MNRGWAIYDRAHYDASTTPNHTDHDAHHYAMEGTMAVAGEKDTGMAFCNFLE